MSLLYLCSERVVFHDTSQGAPPCFYSSLEQTYGVFRCSQKLEFPSSWSEISSGIPPKIGSLTRSTPPTPKSKSKTVAPCINSVNVVVIS